MNKEFNKKFMIEELKLVDFGYWVLSLRPQQPTIGSLVISLKRACGSVGSLASEESKELGIVFSKAEKILSEAFHYSKINFLCLMMVDEQVHFHVIPRYSKPVDLKGEVFVDKNWPLPPDLSVNQRSKEGLEGLYDYLFYFAEENKQIIGYTTGVFDLFHIGHLNVLKNAKSRCDFLIVGVTTDELCQSEKSKQPFIPYAERIEIIKGLDFVDLVVPQKSMDKLEAWKEFKFDKMFVGSDWKGSKRWVDLENRFKKLNVEIVYFPYTKKTSSSKLRELINNKLI